MEREKANEIIISMEMNPEDPLLPKIAVIQLRNYYNGRRDYTPDQIEALYIFSRDAEPEADPNPKREDRKRGETIRKKRTGSRRG